MATIKINELPTSSINSSDFLVKADGNGLATKNTIENLLAPLQTNINNVEQSLEDNVQDEQDARIAADIALQSNIDLKIDIASIVDNVTAGGSGVPLSAEQGKLLKAEILALAGSLIPQGNWDADTNTPDISGTTQTGYYWIVSVAGSTDLDGETDWKVNDWAIKTADGFAKIDNTDKVLSVAGKIGEVVLAKADVGLSNVDNTTDANKPISTAQQTALDLKANLAGGNTITGEQKHNNSGTGTAIDVNNTSTGTGIDILNNLGGFGLYINNNGAGSAIEVAGTSSGFNFVGKDNTVNTFTVDKEGNIVANKANLIGNLTVYSSESTIGNGNGSRVISLIDSSLGNDMGGLQIITGDDNNDEPALLHTNYLGDEAFRISSFGDIISTRGATFSGEVDIKTGPTSRILIRDLLGITRIDAVNADNSSFAPLLIKGSTLELQGDATFGQNIKVKFNESYFTNYTTNGIDYFGDNQSFTIKDEGVDRLKIESAGKVKAFADFEAVGNATIGGSVQANSYKSSDGTVGLTTTFTISGTSYTYKNGLLTGVFSA